MSNRPTRKPSSSVRMHDAAERRSAPPIGLIIGVVAVVLIAVVLAVTLSGGESTNQVATAPPVPSNADPADVDPDAAPFTFGTPMVEGPSLPAHVSGAPDPAVGMAAPVASGQSFDGSPVSMTEGEPTVLVFLAHWCPACQAEVPRLASWMEAEGMPEGVEWLSVTTSTRADGDNFPPAAWLEREGWPVPVLLDDQEGSVAQAYGLSGFPFFVVVDADGNVVARHSGGLSIPEVEAYLDAVR